MGFIGDAVSGIGRGLGGIGGGFLNGASDLFSGNIGGALGSIAGGPLSSFGDMLGGLGIHMPDLNNLYPKYNPPTNPDDSQVTSANDNLNSALQSRLNSQQGNADEIKKDSDSFSANLPGYEANQASNATDQAKSALTNDIYNAKASANSRGMTYSGLNTQGQQDSQVKESSKLAGNIQNLNQNAQTLADQKKQNSFAAQDSVANSQVAQSEAKATQAQSAYQAGLQMQQMQTDYYTGLTTAAATAAGGIIGLGAKALL